LPIWRIIDKHNVIKRCCPKLFPNENTEL